jgi:membrane protein
MAGLTTYLGRLHELLRYYLKGLYQQLNEKDIFLWAQAIAFKVLVTIVPVIILTTGILGQVLRQEKPFETVAGFIRDFLPPYQSDKLLTGLGQLQSASDTLTIIGLATLVFSAMTLVTTLRVVISNVFQEDWHLSRSILGGYLFDLRMAGQVGLLFTLTMGISLAVQVLNVEGWAFFQQAGLANGWLQQLWRSLFRVLTLLIPFLLSMAMFFQLYYFVPKPHPPKRSVFAGAVVAALLWEAAKSAFTFYATHVARFERYSIETGNEVTSALGDTFGLIIAFVFWVYFSGLVLSLGGLIVLLSEMRVRMHRQPAAPPVPPPSTPDALHQPEAPDQDQPDVPDADGADAPPATSQRRKQLPVPGDS